MKERQRRTDSNTILTFSENLSTLFSLRKSKDKNPLKIKSLPLNRNFDLIMNMEKEEDAYI